MYLSYIYANGHTLGAEQDDFTFSWDDKRVGTKVLLAKGFLQPHAAGDRTSAAGLQLYKAHADSYVCSLVPGAAGFQPSQFTPGGLLFKEGDSNMQYVTSTAFLLLAYAKYLSTAGASVSCGGGGGGGAVPPSALAAVARRQVDYILGANPSATSYMVGFGARFPRRVHHRGASMPSVRDHPARIGCDEGFRYLRARRQRAGRRRRRRARRRGRVHRQPRQLRPGRAVHLHQRAARRRARVPRRRPPPLTKLLVCIIGLRAGASTCKLESRRKCMRHVQAFTSVVVSTPL
jgi:hypothetical protein